MTDKTYLEYEAFTHAVRALVRDLSADDITIDAVVSIDRGGLPLGVELSHALNVPHGVLSFSSYDDEHDRDTLRTNGALVSHLPRGHYLLVDDVCDSGITMTAAVALLEERATDVTTAVWHVKPTSTFDPDYAIEETDAWVVYPWETN